MRGARFGGARARRRGRTGAADRDLDAHVQLQRDLDDTDYFVCHGGRSRFSQQQGSGALMIDDTTGDKAVAMPWPGHEQRGGPTLVNVLVTAGVVALFVWSYLGSDIR